MKKINWQYAIGEVLIVIIGITIAFALNNWNDNYKSKRLKKQYLQNLAVDIESEIELLEKNQTACQKKLADIAFVKPFLGNPNIRRDTVIRKVFDIARMINFQPQDITYQTLINSGDLQLIDNFELRKSIEAHFSQHSEILQNYERIKVIHEKYLGNYYIYDVDYDAIRQGDTKFMDNPILKNIMVSLEGSFYMVMASNTKCIESNQALLKMIKKELK